MHPGLDDTAVSQRAVARVDQRNWMVSRSPIWRERRPCRLGIDPVRSVVAAKIGSRRPQKVRLTSARANRASSPGSPPAVRIVSRSSTHASAARSTISSPGLQYQPAICIGGRVKARGKAEAAPLQATGRDTEIDQRNRAELAVDAARRFDVVGDRIGDDTRRNLTVRIDERLGPIARPVDFDADKGTGLGCGAPGQYVLAGTIGGAPPNRIVGRIGRLIRHRQGEGRVRPVDLDPLWVRRGTGRARSGPGHMEKACGRNGNRSKTAHIGENAHESGANIP